VRSLWSHRIYTFLRHQSAALAGDHHGDPGPAAVVRSKTAAAISRICCEILALRGDDPEFRVLVGRSAITGAALLMGADGMVPGPGNSTGSGGGAVRAGSAGSRRCANSSRGSTSPPGSESAPTSPV